MTLTKPEWLSIRPASTSKYDEVKKTVSLLGLHTVCTEAHCPNITECWSGGTATFMVLGEKCTRGCRFCSVPKSARGSDVDPLEPEKLAIAIKGWGLSYVVITSVCRDDLDDQGSAHFANCVRSIKKMNPNTLVELLIPDFMADEECLRRIADSKPDVIGHNIETVRRLSPSIRDRRADYDQSLRVLRTAKRLDASIRTKSAMMLGIGETRDEIVQSMEDLRSAGVDFLALGQYLQPSKAHFPLKEYVRPEQFDELRRIGTGMGFRYVAAGPFVRSSYRAGEHFISSMIVQSKS